MLAVGPRAGRYPLSDILGTRSVLNSGCLPTSEDLNKPETQGPDPSLQVKFTSVSV